MSLQNVDLRKVRHMLALERHRSFTKAADELGLTQSALSRSIQQFEEAAGVNLFDRSRSGVHPTSAGQAVIRQAEAMLHEADAMARLLTRVAGGHQDRITFGMGLLAAPAFLPAVIASALRERPELHCQVLIRSPAELLPRLLAEEIEFLVCAGRLAHGGSAVKGRQFAQFGSVQLVRAGHPLLAQGTTAGIADFPWISVHKLSESRSSLQVAAHLRAEPQIVLEDVASAARITELSDAIWVTSAFAAAREIQEGRLHRLDTPLLVGEPARMMFYNLRDRSLSPAARFLFDAFREATAAFAPLASGG